MKTKDISNQYGIDQNLFEKFLRESSGIPSWIGLMGGCRLMTNMLMKRSRDSRRI
jgi:hypothetical protein